MLAFQCDVAKYHFLYILGALAFQTPGLFDSPATIFVTYRKMDFIEINSNSHWVYLKAHCRGYDWLVVMLKSKTKLWPSSNYQAFMLLDHTLFRE